MHKTLSWLVPFVALSFAGAVAQEKDENIIEADIEFTHKMKLDTTFGVTACNAQLAVSYYQKGPIAHVETELTNDECGPSSGDYEMQVRYRDSSGKIQLKSFAEEWARSDADAIESVRDYFIADDIDIIRVTARRLKCNCAASETDGDSAVPPETTDSD